MHFLRKVFSKFDGVIYFAIVLKASLSGSTFYALFLQREPNFFFHLAAVCPSILQSRILSKCAQVHECVITARVEYHKRVDVTMTSRQKIIFVICRCFLVRKPAPKLPT